MSRHSPNVTFVGTTLSLLARAGVVTMLLGGMFVGCGMMFTPSTPKVSVQDLMAGAPEGDHILLRSAVVDWDAAVTFDPSNPVKLRDINEAVRRFSELRGRLVEVPGTPIGTYRMRTIINRGGVISEERDTRTFAPLDTGGSVWALSESQGVDNADEGSDAEMSSRMIHTGILSPLSQYASLDVLRNPTLDGAHGAGLDGVQATKVPVPDDAVAIVEMTEKVAGDPILLGPVMGTERTLWVAVKGLHHPPEDADLYGKYDLCPDGCVNVRELLPPDSFGLLTLDLAQPRPPERVSRSGVIILLFGLAMLAAALVGKKKLVAK